MLFVSSHLENIFVLANTKVQQIFFKIEAYKNNSYYIKVFKAPMGKVFLPSDISPWSEEGRG